MDVPPQFILKRKDDERKISFLGMIGRWRSIAGSTVKSLSLECERNPLRQGLETVRLVALRMSLISVV